MTFLKKFKRRPKDRGVKMAKRFAFWPTELSGSGFIILWESYYVLKVRSSFNLGGSISVSWHTKRRKQSIFSFRQYLKKNNYIKNVVKENREKKKSIETLKKLLGDKWDKKHHIPKIIHI